MKVLLGSIAVLSLTHSILTATAQSEPEAKPSSSAVEILRSTLTSQVENGRMPGIVALVAQGDQVHVVTVGSMAFDDEAAMQRDTIFRIASLTKPVVAVGALILIEDGVLRLDDPVERWLPELGNRRVLRSLESPLDDTVPAQRPITVRDLLTFQSGYGMVMTFPPKYPIQDAVAKAGFGPGPTLPSMPADELVRRFGELPLVHQPGEGWLYNDASDLLGVLIARASGKPLGEFLQQRLFDPLGMKDSGFYVPEAKLHRLASCYATDFQSGKTIVFDANSGGRFASPPVFESGAGGLVSTVDDYLAFFRMLLDGGRDILSPETVEQMSQNYLSEEQRANPHARALLGDHRGWGFGVSVFVEDAELPAGSFGWDGGYGTSAYVDPEHDLIGILFTQRLWDSPESPPVRDAFWQAASAIVEARQARAAKETE